MAKNVELSDQPIPEEEQRQLSDGVFPYTFGPLDRTSDPFPARFDLLEDVVAHETEGAKLVTARMRQFRDILAWTQAIGTPCGFYLFQTLQAQSKLLQSCCLRLATAHAGFTLKVPLFPWLRANVKDWTAHVKAGGPQSAPLEVLVKSLRTWLNLDRAVGVISGETPDTFRSARNSFVLLDKWLGGTEELALSLPQGGNPDDAACPLEAGLPLGTNALGASAVYVAGVLYAYRLAAAAAEAGAAVKVEPYFKGAPLDLYAVGLYDKQLLVRPPESEAKLLTYLAAHDLAMFTPLHPVFTALRSSMRWDDLHPGHRFKKILAVIEEKGLRLESAAAADYFKLTTTICQALDWPEVPRFADAGAKLDMGDSEDPVRALFKLACEAKEANPAAFFDPAEAAIKLVALAPPGPQLAGFESSRDTDRALSFGLEAELYAAGFQLFFEAKEPEFVCPDFKDVLSQIHSAPEMVETYFGLAFS
jgi:hypothetical protein